MVLAIERLFIFGGIATLDASFNNDPFKNDPFKNDPFKNDPFFNSSPSFGNGSSFDNDSSFANRNACKRTVPNCFSCEIGQPSKCFGCYGLRIASDDGTECYTPGFVYAAFIVPIVFVFVCIGLLVACCVGGLVCCGMGVKKATQKPQYHAGAPMAAPMQGQQAAPAYAQPAAGYVQPAPAYAQPAAGYVQPNVAERPPNYGASAVASE